MGQVLPLPHRGEVFVDPRGDARTLRVSGHPDAATVVLSIWENTQCRATFRLAAHQVDALVGAILSAAPPRAPQPQAPDGLPPTAQLTQLPGRTGWKRPDEPTGATLPDDQGSTDQAG